jgi:hypothetical protein
MMQVLAQLSDMADECAALQAEFDVGLARSAVLSGGAACNNTYQPAGDGALNPFAAAAVAAGLAVLSNPHGEPAPPPPLPA